MDFFKLPQVSSAIQHPHKIIFQSDEMLLIHCTVSNVFVAECKETFEKELAQKIKNQTIIRLQTTNQKLFELLKEDFKHNYQCQQAVYKGPFFNDFSIELLHQKDLDFVAASYEMPEYINQLYQRNRLFAYYEENILKGYVAFHIDETVGALYVKPEYRSQGLGAKIMKEAFCLYNKQFPEKTVYSQIVSDNEKSIKLHEKLGCIFSEPVYWLYNQEYTY